MMNMEKISAQLSNVQEDITEIKKLLENYPVRMDRVEQFVKLHKGFIYLYVITTLGLIGTLLVIAFG